MTAALTLAALILRPAPAPIDPPGVRGRPLEVTLR